MEINKNVKIRYKVTLSQEERAQLMQIIKKGGHKSQKVRRALILLNCDESEYGEPDKSTNEEIAKTIWNRCWMCINDPTVPQIQ